MGDLVAATYAQLQNIPHDGLPMDRESCIKRSVRTKRYCHQITRLCCDNAITSRLGEDFYIIWARAPFKLTCQRAVVFGVAAPRKSNRLF